MLESVFRPMPVVTRGADLVAPMGLPAPPSIFENAPLPVTRRPLFQGAGGCPPGG